LNVNNEGNEPTDFNSPDARSCAHIKHTTERLAISASGRRVELAALNKDILIVLEVCDNADTRQLLLSDVWNKSCKSSSQP